VALRFASHTIAARGGLSQWSWGSRGDAAIRSGNASLYADPKLMCRAWRGYRMLDMWTRPSVNERCAVTAHTANTARLV